ncbi:MAG: S9 family peptidase [Rhodothermales bacterium]
MHRRHVGSSFHAGVPALIVLCLMVSSSAVAQDAPPRRTLTVDDFFAIHRVQDPRISPDGRWVAYTVTETDLEKDKSETRIWMIPAAGGEALPMTAKGSSASRPRWSPDGTYLSFLAARNGGKTQVWTLNRNGGEAQQLTDIKQGVGSYAWSPDGTRLVLTVRDPEPENDDEDKDKKDKPEPWVIDRLQFKRDYAGYLDDRRTHLYVFDLRDKSVRQITSGPYDEAQAAWHPDGNRIAFVSNRTDTPDANRNTDIWVVSADNTDQGRTLLQVTTNPGADSAPAWSPDGQQLAYVTVTEPDLIWYATNHLAVVRADGSAPRVLTASLDRNVSTPRFAPDGQSIYFLLEDSAERHLARMDLSGRHLTRLIAGERSVRSYMMAPDGTIATLISEAHRPGEVFLFEKDTLRRLTSVNDGLIDGVRLAEVRNVQFTSRDGTEIEGFIFTPPGYDSALRYPTLLRIHGGPVSQYDFRFNFEAQLFAAHGYVVVTTNPRGSSGYGQDFSLAIWQDWGNKDFEDVMAGVEYAVDQGYADPERLGVGGWSYGGILTNYVITKTDRFKAAITGASEVLYRSNYGHDHYQYQWEKELGLPWQNPEAWERISPFNDVENIITPTLIMGGEKDWNVPILNSEQLYQALRRLGRTTQLVVYPGEHHGIRRPTFQKDRYERYLAWYDQYVKGDAVSSVSPGEENPRPRKP